MPALPREPLEGRGLGGPDGERERGRDGERARTPRVFVDTNVWISALINPYGPPARVIGALVAGRLIPVVSQALYDEIVDVANRPRIRRRRRATDEELALLLALVRDRAVEAMPTGSLRVCRDPDDDVLLETAVLGAAEFAVSRDDDLKRDPELMARLRERGVTVLSVAQLLSLLQPPDGAR